MRFKQITIIGVGLIGGSIGLAIKKRGLASRVIGVTAHKSTLGKARRRKAIDIGTLEVKKSVLHSDMVILATPVDKVLSTLNAVRPYLKNGCIVIDVASVKGAIVDAAERSVGRKAFFVGTHPMAGSERRGIDKADSELFSGAPCVLTVTRRTNRDALQVVSGFWKELGSKIYMLSPSEHDKRISNISHLPHIAAFALSLASKDRSLPFAAAGFKDATRIAASDPALWAPILLANRGNVVRDMDDYLERLKRFRASIIRGRKKRLLKMLSQAKKKRDILNIR